MKIGRRNFITAATALAATAPTAARALGSRPATTPQVAKVDTTEIVRKSGIRPALLVAALEALEQHGSRARRDRIGVVDFAMPSSTPRFHLIDLEAGSTTSLLVSHGSGSDPSHSGWLQRFSNRPGSNASCEGSFLTSQYYSGKHGRSQKLIGLDPTNNNALSRAIVIHGAWYAENDMIDAHGKLGRSQGCLAVGNSKIAQTFAHLGEGRLIYAAKLGHA